VFLNGLFGDFFHVIIAGGDNYTFDQAIRIMKNKPADLIKQVVIL